LTRTVILFEDHTAQNFRPLSWSLPVYEIPCGLFTLRERVQFLAAEDETPCEIVLRPRGLLAALQADSLPPGVRSEPTGDADDVLFLSARVGARWDDLRALLQDLPVDVPLRDAHGLVAWRTGAEGAQAAGS